MDLRLCYVKYIIAGLSITSPSGIVPIKTVYTQYSDKYDGFSDAVDTFFYWVMFIGLLVVMSLFIFVFLIWERFARGLLVSEDFYLDQKIAYEKDPKKFEPKDIPADVEKLLKINHG